ncbi:hypothetical protein H8959_011692 [Pygathrix nigripes]
MKAFILVVFTLTRLRFCLQQALRMKAAGILTLVGCLVTGAESKIYTRCKLAKIFSRAGLDNYGGFSLGNWICMAYYESGYNTTAQRVLDDGSIDYGIFQINSVTWCRHGKLRENNHCHVACSALITDDLTDAIICAKKIVKETQGMNYWSLLNGHSLTSRTVGNSPRGEMKEAPKHSVIRINKILMHDLFAICNALN